MRRAVVALIAAREFRDQLRDRRTLFLILGLPALMYPLFVTVFLGYVEVMKGKTLVVGVAGGDHLPQGATAPDAAAVVGPAAVAAADLARPYPRLTDGDSLAPEFARPGPAGLGVALRLTPVAGPDESLLASREIDALLVVEPGFTAALDRGERPTVRVVGRDGDENSKLAVQRLTSALRDWRARVRQVRFGRAGLPADFDTPFQIKDPGSEKSEEKRVADEVRDLLVKVFPFLLVMWMLTGAVHPAVDMTAGEKERGTMETLLISPAGRGEIVAGKFLATTALGFGTAVWNVALMLAAVVAAQAALDTPLVSLPGLAASVLAAVPIAMLFAAVCLALGVFARGTKEGNYYMVPVFLVAMPLSYLSMAPGVELDGLTSWVPLTNALLLQQRLMAVRADPFPWQHVPAVVVSLGVCVAVALAAAVAQFRRESVLFREAGGGRTWSLFGRGK